MHDKHYEYKSYKLKLLGKLAVQDGVRASIGENSYVQNSLPHIYTLNLLIQKDVDCGCLAMSL